MGCFLVLIFLPPRFHLLLQMEVSDLSTLVRIRTDYWPCLAYVDDYLEVFLYVLRPDNTVKLHNTESKRGVSLFRSQTLSQSQNASEENFVEVL
ncbi:hypothetical protein NC651_019133 [Populus alba x Populus x berolinensis]|nr:hypothetical protein NC651_019133 [Populus alba x Populus x berolinensis]